MGGSKESQGCSLTTPNLELFKLRGCSHLFLFLSEKWKLLKTILFPKIKGKLVGWGEEVSMKLFELGGHLKPKGTPILGRSYIPPLGGGISGVAKPTHSPVSSFSDRIPKFHLPIWLPRRKTAFPSPPYYSVAMWLCSCQSYGRESDAWNLRFLSFKKVIMPFPCSFSLQLTACGCASKSRVPL